MQLTRRQREILDFLRDNAQDFGHPPTLDELCAMLRLRSRGSLHKHVKALVTAGFVEPMDGQPFRLSRIRAKRDRPGLRPQHLAALLAAAQVSGAKVRGDRIGSEEIELASGPVRPGDYFFDLTMSMAGFYPRAPASFRHGYLVALAQPR